MGFKRYFCKDYHKKVPPTKKARISLKLNHKHYQIGSFYSAPSCRLTARILWSIVNELGGHFLLGGDFNSKHPRWGSSIMSPRGQHPHDVAYQLGLDFIHPIQPTHYSDAGYAPDVLDFLSLNKALDIVSLLKFYMNLVRTITLLFRHCNWSLLYFALEG
jgi:hypothetical protein